MPFPFIRPRDPNQPRLSFMQRALGVGANMLFPGLGTVLNQGSRYYNNNSTSAGYYGMGSSYSAADRRAINGPSLSSENLGFSRPLNMGQYSGSTPQPGSNTTNQQLAQTMEQWVAQQNQARIAAARGGQQNQNSPVNQYGPQIGAGVVSADNPYGSYRTRDETGAQRDSRYATEAQAVAMRDSTNEAINAQELAAYVRGRMK